MFKVYYDVFVSSETGFRSFEFGGYTYCCISVKNREGVESPSYSGGVLVADMEKTLVDSIKDMDKIGGVEEIVQCIECISGLREDRLIKDISTKRYDGDWKLVVPAEIFHRKNGVNEYADI